MSFASPELVYSTITDSRFVISPSVKIIHTGGHLATTTCGTDMQEERYQSGGSNTFCSSFCSMDEMILQEARREPMTFLYATLKRFLSSTLSSGFDFTTFFMQLTISERKRHSNAPLSED